MQYTSHGKAVVFEGNVHEVTTWIQKQIGEHKTVSLRDYFKDEVWGVHKIGEENYRYYYQCLGKGRYSIFTMQ
jgi:hypothetical protein